MTSGWEEIIKPSLYVCFSPVWYRSLNSYQRNIANRNLRCICTWQMAELSMKTSQSSHHILPICDLHSSCTVISYCPIISLWTIFDIFCPQCTNKWICTLLFLAASTMGEKQIQHKPVALTFADTSNQPTEQDGEGCSYWYSSKRETYQRHKSRDDDEASIWVYDSRRWYAWENKGGTVCIWILEIVELHTDLKDQSIESRSTNHWIYLWHCR